MRTRIITTLAVVVASFAFASTSALADNPHYIYADSGLSGTDLTANFKIAGLGDNVTIDVTLAGTATAQYACFNGGGKHPQATNKATFTAPFSQTGTFTSGKNGSVNGTLRVSAPGPFLADGSEFTCPNGQKRVLTFVSYTNITLSSIAGTVNLADQTAGALV